MVLLVVVREKLRLVGGHVHLHRTFPLAPFARETQIERLMHFFARPAVRDLLAAQHLVEQMRPPTRRVLLFVRHHVAGAHCRLVVLPALADADAAQRRVREAVVILVIAEVHCFGSRIPDPRSRPDSKILIERIGIDHLARIHLPVGIPDRFELSERLHQLGAEHTRQQLAPRLPVAMFARERSAVPVHEVRGVLHERSEFGDAFHRLQIEADAAVDASLAEMTEQIRGVLVFLVEPVQIAQVRAELVGRDRRIVPAGAHRGLAADRWNSRAASLADLPQLLLLIPRLEHADVRCLGPRAQLRHERLGARARLLDRVGGELDVEPSVAIGQQAEVLGVNAAVPPRTNEHLVDALEASGAMLEDGGRGVRRFEDVGIAEDDERAAREVMNEIKRRFEHVCER